MRTYVRMQWYSLASAASNTRWAFRSDELLSLPQYLHELGHGAREVLSKERDSPEEVGGPLKLKLIGRRSWASTFPAAKQFVSCE
jgi:hypothetical protein